MVRKVHYYRRRMYVPPHIRKVKTKKGKVKLVHVRGHWQKETFIPYWHLFKDKKKKR